MSFLENLFATKQTSTLIDSAFGDIEGMLKDSKRMLEIALDTLIDNAPLTEDLDRLDDEVDKGEQLVRRAVLQHLSVNPGNDLVPSLILVSIVQDCERIGDFARGLGDIVGLAASDREGVFRAELASTRELILPMFDQASAAFVGADSAKAQGVVDAATQAKTKLSALVAAVAASDESADMAVVYSASARILSRVASHLSNVCSTVTKPYDLMRHGDESA